MSQRTSNLLTGATGLIGVILVLISAFIAGQPPAADDPVSDIREHFVDNRTLLLVGAFFNMLAFPFIAWFIVAVRARLAVADDTPLPIVALATLFVVGGLSLVATALAGGVLYVDGFAETASDDVVQFASSALTLVYGYASIGFVVVMGSFGISALRGKTFPAWNAWLALVLAVVAILGLISVFDAGMGLLAFAAFLAFVVWVAATAVVFLLAARTEAA